MLTHGELFAGISGFGSGFAEAGIKTLWHVEKNAACRRVLQRHYPDSLLLDDICKVQASDLPRVNIISFGSPCQDLSIAGKQKGLKGERSGLFYEAIRLINELGPDIAVWENVPGAFASNGGRDFAAILTAFRELRPLDLAWRTLDAQYFGVPQRRRRIFLIADFTGERAAEILFEQQSSNGNTKASKQTRRTAARVTTSGIGADNREREDCMIPQLLAFNWQTGGDMRIGANSNQTSALSVGQVPAIAFGDGKVQPLTMTATLASHGQRLDFETETFIFEPRHYTRESGGKPSKVAHVLRARSDLSDSHPHVVVPFSNGQGKPNASQDNTRYCLDSQKGSMAGVAGSFGVRRLTPLEYERLQGFDDGWTEGESDSARYKMLGNAVCRKVTAWIGKRIVKALAGN